MGRQKPRHGGLAIRCRAGAQTGRGSSPSGTAGSPKSSRSRRRSARHEGEASRCARLVYSSRARTVSISYSRPSQSSGPPRLTLEYAQALIDYGAALRRSGHRMDARKPLREGLDLAHRCGATVLSDRARHELLATGARPRRPLLRGRDALTPTEARVADMAAHGLSSPEIAQALFVTPKTIETHLGHVYQKLDIHSRAELPRALSQPTSA